LILIKDIRNVLKNCIITFLNINCVPSQKKIKTCIALCQNISTHPAKYLEKYNKWQHRFVRFIETEQESVTQKATKHQQALLHVF